MIKSLIVLFILLLPTAKADLAESIVSTLTTVFEYLQNPFILWLIGVSITVWFLYTVFKKGGDKIWGKDSSSSKNISKILAVLSAGSIFLVRGNIDVLKQVSWMGFYGGLIAGIFFFLSKRSDLMQSRFKTIATKASPIALFGTGALWYFIGNLFGTNFLLVLGIIAVVMSPLWIILGGRSLRHRQERMMMDESYREKMQRKRRKHEKKRLEKSKEEHRLNLEAEGIEKQLREQAQKEELIIDIKLGKIENKKQRIITQVWSFLKILKNIQSEINAYKSKIKKGFKIMRVEDFITRKQRYKASTLQLLEELEEVEKEELRAEEEAEEGMEKEIALEKEAIAITGKEMGKEKEESVLELKEEAETAEETEKLMAESIRKKVLEEKRKETELINKLVKQKKLDRKEKKLLKQMTESNKIELEDLRKTKFYVEQDKFYSALTQLKKAVADVKREEEAIRKIKKGIKKELVLVGEEAEISEEKEKMGEKLAKEGRQEVRGLRIH